MAASAPPPCLTGPNPTGETLRDLAAEDPRVQNAQLVNGLAAAFGFMAVVLAALGVIANLVILVPAVFFAVVAGLFWYHGSGRLAARFYRRVEQRARAARGRGPSAARGREDGAPRGGFGAGPREDWTGPRRDRGQEPGSRAGRQRRAQQVGSQGQRADGGRAGGGGPSTAGGDAQMTAQRAHRILGVDPGADQGAIKQAYRRRVKETHPDADGGGKKEFRAVRAAYERLAD